MSGPCMICTGGRGCARTHANALGGVVLFPDVCQAPLDSQSDAISRPTPDVYWLRPRGKPFAPVCKVGHPDSPFQAMVCSRNPDPWRGLTNARLVSFFVADDVDKMLANTPDRLSSDGDGDAAVVATEPAARSKDTDRLKDAGECLNEAL